MVTCMDYKPAKRFRNHTIIEGQCNLNIMPSHQEHNEMCDNCLKNWVPLSINCNICIIRNLIMNLINGNDQLFRSICKYAEIIIYLKQGHLGLSTRLTIADIRALQWKL